MSPSETALRFVKFFASGDLQALSELLSRDLEFRGPLLTAYSSAEYLEALEANPPEPTPHRIISVTENPRGEVAVFWEYLKPDKPTTIATLFLVRKGEVREMRVIFTTHGQDARLA